MQVRSSAIFVQQGDKGTWSPEERHNVREEVGRVEREKLVY